MYLLQIEAISKIFQHQSHQSKEVWTNNHWNKKIKTNIKTIIFIATCIIQKIKFFYNSGFAEKKNKSNILFKKNLFFL